MEEKNVVSTEESSVNEVVTEPVSAPQEKTDDNGGQRQEVHNAQFQELAEKGGTENWLDIDFILDIPLTVNVELGKSRLLIGELLQLGQGSILELTKLAGEPMDVFVNDRLIARGEVVVVNEKFGVRLTDVVSPAERISRLK